MITDEIIIALLREDGLDAYKRYPDSPTIVINYKNECIGFALRDGYFDSMLFSENHVEVRFPLSDPNWIDELKVWLETWKGPICYA